MPDQISVSAVVRAQPQQAWDMFTTPHAITQWNAASPDWHCPHASVDLRIGGRYLARMESRDGTMGFDFAAVYDHVAAPDALTLVMDDGRIAHTTFVATDAGTCVTTLFDPETMNPVAMQQAGWQAILDNYAAYVNRQR